MSARKRSLGEEIASEFYNGNAVLAELINEKTAPLLARIAELEGAMRSVNAVLFPAPDAEEETRRQKEAFRSDMQDDL